MSDRVVYKYEMPQPGKSAAVKMERSWLPLHVDVQGGRIMLWVEVDANETLASQVTFETVATGRPVASNQVHVGTVLDGAFVWHVYRREDAHA